MTWTQVHSIADTGTGSSQGAADAAAYVLDTLMPTKGFTVAAHPDASAFKRIMSYTVDNEITGSPYTFHWWANYQSTTSSNQFSWYDDVTYTTAPGDLANNTSFVQNWTVSSSYPGAGQTWRFWTSDQSANSFLVTRGRKVWMYWPGFTSACIYEDDAWDGSFINSSTCVMPMVNTSNFRVYHAPLYGTGANISYVHPGIGSPNVAGVVYDGLFQGYEMMIANSGAALDSYATRCFSITAADVLLLLPNLATTNRSVWNSATTPCDTVKLGANYYLSSRDGRQSCSLMFDFGTSEPDFS